MDNESIINERVRDQLVPIREQLKKDRNDNLKLNNRVEVIESNMQELKKLLSKTITELESTSSTPSPSEYANLLHVEDDQTKKIYVIKMSSYSHCHSTLNGCDLFFYSANGMLKVGINAKHLTTKETPPEPFWSSLIPELLAKSKIRLPCRSEEISKMDDEYNYRLTASVVMES